MKTLNNFIVEKLKINKNMVVQTDDVLVLQKQQDTFAFDLNLFLHVLSQLNNDTKINDITIIVDKVWYSRNGTTYAPYTLQQYYSLGKDVYVIKSGKTLIVKTYVNSETFVTNVDMVDKLINTLEERQKKSLNIKSFNFYGQDATWLYLWISNKDKVIKLYLSTEDYETLKDKKTFV